MSKIGVWSDCHNFPSLPLMKLSAYHKAKNDTVEFVDRFKHYDKIYASKVFSFTPDIEDSGIVSADEIEKGGTGYCISVVNGKEIFDKANLKGYCKDDEEIQLCTRILDGLLMFKERKRHSILFQATKKARGAE